MRLPLALAAAAAAFAAAPAAASQDMIVRCVVRYGSATFEGECVQGRELDGPSFGITPEQPEYFTGRIYAIEVAVLPGGGAQVRAYSRTDRRDPFDRPWRLPHGPASIRTHHWGTAVRSARDPNCWVGRGFSVCTYQAA